VVTPGPGPVRKREGPASRAPPVPTSGYFLIVPEEEVAELNWSPEQALQAIISAGLTAPPEVRYFKTILAAERVAAGLVTSGGSSGPRDDGRSPLA
jgi:hypothetical protein